MPSAVDHVESVWVAASSAQVATVQPRPWNRIIRRLVIVGPAYSRFTLYEGLVIAEPFTRSTTNLGTRNTANLDPPLLLPAGASALGVWVGGDTAAATKGYLTVEYDRELPGG